MENMSNNTSPHIVRGADLSDCVAYTIQLGGTVEPVRRTGELRFSHPAADKTVRVNGRRKDAPRQLTTWLKHLVRAN